MPRDNTTLEAAGAEMLVVGRLLIERLQAFKAYANQPGYDLLVVNPESGRSAKVQVKARTATDAGGFRVSNPDFDFVVFVRLNRGTKLLRRSGVPEGTLEPEFYIVPRDEFAAQGLFGRRFRISTISSAKNYKDAWHLIVRALASKLNPVDV